MRALILVVIAFAAAANADELSVNLDSSTLTGLPGDTLMFTGTLTNNTSDTLFINSDSFTFDIAGALDDSPFLLNAPISLDGGVTSSDFEMFDIDIPPGQGTGAYMGSFTVLGGVDGNAQDNLGTASFEVDVVPEPASYLLFGSALAMLAGWRVLRARLAKQ